MTIEIDPLTGAPIVKSNVPSANTSFVVPETSNVTTDKVLVPDVSSENDSVAEALDELANKTLVVKKKSKTDYLKEIESVLKYGMDSQQVAKAIKDIEKILDS